MPNALRDWEVFNQALGDHNSTADSRSERLSHSLAEHVFVLCLELGQANC
jgi:hypothetical protein